jgi:hypothetical protein
MGADEINRRLKCRGATHCDILQESPIEHPGDPRRRVNATQADMERRTVADSFPVKIVLRADAPHL